MQTRTFIKLKFFWAEKKNLSSKPKPQSLISIENWFIHFSIILSTVENGNSSNKIWKSDNVNTMYISESDNVNRANMDEILLSDIEYTLCNSPITDKEIIGCVHKLNITVLVLSKLKK